MGEILRDIAFENMITVKQIKGGKDYLKNHLQLNDYYSEGERVAGKWKGKLAEKFGLNNQAVTSEQFHALKNNQHPVTGEMNFPKRETQSCQRVKDKLNSNNEKEE